MSILNQRYSINLKSAVGLPLVGYRTAESRPCYPSSHYFHLPFIIKTSKVRFQQSRTSHKVHNNSFQQGNAFMQFVKILKTIFALSIVFIVVACGGGGSSGAKNTGSTGNLVSTSSSSISNTTISQTFNFVKAGTYELVAGDIFVNQAVGLGAGLVTYSSSDTKVAQVGGDGIVSIVGGGSVEITAKIAEDKTYASASTTYKINAATDFVGFTAWVGKQHTTVSFPASMKGLELYQSAATTCNLTDIMTCIDSKHTLLNDTNISDSPTTLTQGSHYLLNDNNRQASLNVSVNTKTPKGITSNVVIFKGEMLVLVSKFLLGSSYDGTPSIFLNAIYSSSDGVNWNLKTNQLPFSYREKTALAVFNNQVWLIGGAKTNDPVKNDVWVSPDGVEWTEKSQINPFTARANHRVVVFNSQLWVVGGESRISNYEADDIWSSVDGANWVLKSKPTFTSWTREFSCVVFQNKLWSFQGTNVWSSLDGIAWQLQTEKGPLGDNLKFGNEFLVFDNKLWVFPANPYPHLTKNDVFVSDDGINWQKKTITAPHTSALVKAAVFKNQMWLIGTDITTSYSGGILVTGNYVTWSSYDGALWREMDVSANFKSDINQIMQSVNDNLLLINLYKPNGFDNVPQYTWLSQDGLHWDRNQVQGLKIVEAGQWLHHNDQLLYIAQNADGLEVYSTENGLNWAFQRTTNNRRYASVVSFKEKLFMLGGANEGVLTNSILSSTDGTMWIRESDAAPFPTRGLPVVKALSNKIILMGGETIIGDETKFQDVWISEDGTHWTQQNAGATNLSPVGQAAIKDPENIVVFNDKLWFITTKEDYPNGFKNQLWSSTDGVNWVMSPDLPFVGRYSFNLLVHANKIWVIGGRNSFSPNDTGWDTSREVWNTTDGIEWKQGYKGLLEFK